MSVSLEAADYSDLSWTDHEVRLVERVIEDLAEVLYTLKENPHCDLTDEQIRQVRLAFHKRITKLDLMDALWGSAARWGTIRSRPVASSAAPATSSAAPTTG